MWKILEYIGNILFSPLSDIQNPDVRIVDYMETKENRLKREDLILNTKENDIRDEITIKRNDFIDEIKKALYYDIISKKASSIFIRWFDDYEEDGESK